MKKYISRNQISIFALVNILLTIILAIFFSFEAIPFQLAPALIAIWITYIIEGKSGVNKLLQKVKFRKQYIIWYLISFVTPFIFGLLSYLCFSYMRFGKLLFQNTDIPIVENVILFSVMILGSYGEEIGWRGFLLPNMMKKYSLVKSSFIVGVIWGLWHLKVSFGLPIFITYLFLVVELSFIFSWIYHKTKGNILSTIILHSFFNISTYLFFYSALTSDNQKENLLLGIYGNMTMILLLPCLFVVRKMIINKKMR